MIGSVFETIGQCHSVGVVVEDILRQQNGFGQIDRQTKVTRIVIDGGAGIRTSDGWGRLMVG